MKSFFRLKMASLLKPTLKRSNSLAGIEELVICGICLEVMKNPKMLSCQHTFCCSCLKNVYKSAKAKKDNMKCPICQVELQVSSSESIENLPGSLHVESLLKLLEEPASPKSQLAESTCNKCNIVLQENDHICQHCLKTYCTVCWTAHLKELDNNLKILAVQLTESKPKLEYKAQHFKKLCEELERKISLVSKLKIQELQESEQKLLNQLAQYKVESYNNREALLKSTQKLIDDLNKGFNEGTTQKVSKYLEWHKETSKILTEVNSFGDAKIIFDADSFKLDQVVEGIYNDLDDVDLKKSQIHATYESQYRNRTFLPKLLWNKCPKPAGVAVAPWNPYRVYIAGSDSKMIIIFDKSVNKVQGRISHHYMLCPNQLCFSPHSQLFVTDKWQNCIHVFNMDKYTRTICDKQLKSPEGIVISPENKLLVSDSGNNRILVLDPGSGAILGRITGSKPRLSQPSGLALYNDCIIVADTGNHRIKLFDMDGSKLDEFGAMGTDRGQFRYAEAVAIDPRGFILVGDAGNARVQVFSLDGTLVKIFGSKEGFGWISGLYVTPDYDIIATDRKNKTLRIF